MDRHQYETFAQIDKHHWWFTARRAVISSILPKDQQGISVIDVGAGTGGMVPMLAKNFDLTVYEPDSQTLEFTKEKYQKNYPSVRFVGGDWSNVQRLRGNYDIVTAFDVLEHCEDDLQTLSEWRALLRQSGGNILLTVPAFPCLWGANDELSHHYRRYTKATLIEALQRAGLQVAKISYINSINFLPVWISRNVKERLERALRRDKADAPWDFGLPPALLNSLLHQSFAWEQFLVPHLEHPIGTSLIAVAHAASQTSAVVPESQLVRGRR
jgi:ubiquinone/menaquinone biosynthesis C-methylase UbiE